MTEQSSCKRGFFGKYLLYRIDTLKGNLLICAALNLFGLPFFALGHLHISSAQLNGTKTNENFFLYSTFCGNLCVYVMILAAVIGAALSFSYCNKKEWTDTLGVLPLTHGERFWGDFLGGYITNVAPFIPSAVIAVIMFAVVHKNYSVTAIHSGTPVEDHIGFIIGLSLTLFFVYTFCYIISVLVTSIFGRLIFAELFSVIGVIVFTLLIMGISGTFLNEMPGVPAAHRDTCYAMPLGPLFGEVGESLYKTGAFANWGYTVMEFSSGFSILDPLNILIFIVLAAALIAISYYITKTRKQERVGRIIAHGAAYRGLQLVSAAAAIMFTASLNSGDDIIPSIYIGTAIGAVIVIVLEIIRRPCAKEILKTIVGYMGTFACCFWLCMLFGKTGAFGLRYIKTSPEQVEYINVSVSSRYERTDYSGYYKITEQNDIRQLTESHNSALGTYGNLIKTGDDYVLEYKLTNGETLRRGYENKSTASNPIPYMLDNVRSLEGYPKALCGFMTDGSTIESCSAALEDAYGTIEVPTDKLEEFLGILTSEVIEKYSKNAARCGGAWVGVAGEYGGYFVNFSIQNDFTKTIEYLRALDNANEDKEDMLAFTVKLEYGRSLYLNICVYKKDLEDELVKELLSLLEQGSAPDWKISRKIAIESTNSINYYVPIDKEKDVAKIMLEFAGRAE